MNDAVVAYLTWNRVVPWKVLSLPEQEGGALVPVGYGSNSRAFGKRVVPGTMIFVVSLPRRGRPGIPDLRTYRPTLVARLRVEQLCTRCDCPARIRSKGVADLLEQWQWVAVSNRKDSVNRFFELNDATGALEHLGFLRPRPRSAEALPTSAGIATAQETDLPSLRKEIGEKLQSPRILAGAGDEAVAAFRHCVEQSEARNVFISYAHRDGELALDLADELLREGFSPWLDSLAIPRYRLEREKEKSEGRLHRLIRIGINRSNFAVAIVTKRYGRTPWTRLESEWIASRHESDPGFDCRQIILGGEEIKGMGSSLPSTSVPKLAHELAAWWDSRRRAATD